MSFLVSIPPSTNSSEIVAILDTIDRKIELHRKKRAVLDELFRTLLHKLMTGEIRVADLDLGALPLPPTRGCHAGGSAMKKELIVALHGRFEDRAHQRRRGRILARARTAGAARLRRMAELSRR